MLQQSMASREAASVFGHMVRTHYISSFSGFWEYIIMHCEYSHSKCALIEHTVCNEGVCEACCVLRHGKSGPPSLFRTRM